MIQSWFSTPERLERFQSSCESWLGTPFAGNSESKGPKGGVSCQKLLGSILRECGLDIPHIQDAPMAHARTAHNDQSLIENAAVEWERLGIGVRLPTESNIPIVGDILGFKIGHILHHVGLYYGNSSFIHVVTGSRVSFSSLLDPTWQSRLRLLFRINYERE